MNKILLKKVTKKKKLEKIKLPLEGLHMTPHLKNHKNLIEIKEMVIIEKELKRNIIRKQFDRSFRKIVAIMMDITASDDTTSSDCKIALDEIAKMQSMLMKKAQKELAKKELEQLKKKLAVVEAKIEKKFIEIRSMEMIQEMTYQKEYQKENGRSR